MYRGNPSLMGISICDCCYMSILLDFFHTLYQKCKMLIPFLKYQVVNTFHIFLD